MIERTQMPFVDEPFGGASLFGKQRYQLHAQHFASCLRSFGHRYCIDICTCHGLFAIHMFVRAQGGNRDGRMKVVVQTDIHRVDVVAL